MVTETRKPWPEQVWPYSKDPPDGLFPYLNYLDGSGYGLEFHFLVRELADRFIVFNKIDGAIWLTLMNDDMGHWNPISRRSVALMYAHQACLEWNGLYKPFGREG